MNLGARRAARASLQTETKQDHLIALSFKYTERVSRSRSVFPRSKRRSQLTAGTEKKKRQKPWMDNAHAVLASPAFLFG